MSLFQTNHESHESSIIDRLNIRIREECVFSTQAFVMVYDSVTKQARMRYEYLWDSF